MKLFRIILFPFSILYYIVTYTRNKLFDCGLYKSESFDLPIICVGNLRVGGTGKTPMVEYLANHFSDNYKVAILSRGYKRKTKGYILANETSDALTIGDEPFQYYNKFKNIIVAVSEKRVLGVEKLLSESVKPEIILLDDAYQHRYIKASTNILLTSYGDLYSDDYLIPVGNLRENRKGAERASYIIVTKCPTNLSEKESISIKNKLKPLANQSLYFTSILYDNIARNLNGSVNILELKKIVLITGIANPSPLLIYLESKNIEVKHYKYNDHHEFKSSDISNITNQNSSEAIILTTEKDYTKLKEFNIDRIYYISIKIDFLFGKTPDFLS
ncbi:MAG: tetraacyldisaccharide 4'-kinase [Flavobacteriaceae bacterium]|nr:tetraacyldisaccharide 4'-kinase [Flavobacteriaceae bacterium]